MRLFALFILLFVVGCGSERESTTPSDAPIAAGEQQIQTGLPIGGTASSADPKVNPGEPESSQSDTRQPEDLALGSVSELPLDPLMLVDTASIALENGDIDEAFGDARQAYRIAPKHPEVAFLMARLLGERQRFHEAIEMLDRLSVSHPNMRLPILGQTATWMVQAGQWEDAETRFSEILEQVPSAAIVHRNLVKLYTRQGRRSKAFKHAQLLCRMGDVNESELRTLLNRLCALPATNNEQTPEPIGHLGDARAAISRGEWESALLHLEPASVEMPDAMALEAEALLARSYATTENRALQEYLDSKPNLDHPDIWFARGVLAAKKNQHLDAIRFFANCIIADQTDCDAYLAMSRSLESVGMAEQARNVVVREKLVRRTQRLGESSGDTLKRESIAELAATLDQLQRPLEAIAWRGVSLAYAQSRGMMSETAIRSGLVEINEARSACLASNKESPDQEFLLCGIELEELRHMEDDSRNTQTSATP